MSQKDKRILVYIFLFALIIRGLILIFYLPVPEKILTPLNDSTDYHHLAKEILKFSYSSPSGKPTAFRAPVYPFFLAIIYLVSGEGNLIAVALVQAVLDSFNTVLMSILAFMIWKDTRSILLAGLIGAIYPVFVFQTNQILSEVLHRTIQLIFLIFLIKAVKDGNIKNVILAGIIYALSILNKPVLLIVYPFLCFWLWYVWKKDEIRNRIIMTLIFAVVVMCGVGVWTLRNFFVSGKFIPVSTNFPITFAAGVTKFSFYTHKWYGEEKCMPVTNDYLYLTQLRFYDGIEEELSIGRFYARQAFKFIEEHPAFYVVLTIRKFLHFWSPFIRNKLVIQIIAFISMAPVLLLGWIGIIHTLIKRKDERSYAILAIIIAIPTTLVYAISQPDIRYRVSIIDPIWIIFAVGLILSMRRTSKIFKG